MTIRAFPLMAPISLRAGIDTKTLVSHGSLNRAKATIYGTNAHLLRANPLKERAGSCKATTQPLEKIMIVIAVPSSSVVSLPPIATD